MSEFYYPRTIVQYAEYPEQNVSWSNNVRDVTIANDPEYNLANPNTGAGDKNVITTVRPLLHIPNSGRGAQLDKTYYLKCTNFGLKDLPSTITGISLSLYTQRNGKIVDDTVCLIHNDQIISDNKTSLLAAREGHIKNGNNQVYGGEQDLWGATITKEMLEDNSFGVLLRFSSNPLYPHKEGMQVYKILLKLYPYDLFVFESGTDVEFITEDSVADYFVSE